MATTKKVPKKNVSGEGFKINDVPFKASLIPAQPLYSTSVEVSKPQVSVKTNNDQAIITWKYKNAIQDCIGFAVYRRLNNENVDEAEPLMNRVGFVDEEYIKGEQKPSTEWPIQRFMWTDFTVKEGDKVSYKIVPMLFDGEKLIKDLKNSSAWTDTKSIATGIDAKDRKSKFKSYFNRGIISSQFYSRMQHDLADELPGKTLKDIINGPNNKLRDFLGGFADNRLFQMLDRVINDQSLTVYGALYELHQQDLVDKLCQIGKRANIILANGAAKKRNEDKNSDSRKELKKHKVHVLDRIVDVTKKHFAHNKFLIICNNDTPEIVVTGSTNWTPGGMFAQVNNLLIIENKKVAELYLEEWNALADDVVKNDNDYGDDLYNHNDSAKVFDGNSRIWFTPTPNYGDLSDVENLMESAQHGILFLMFNPGPKNSFFNYIQDIQSRKSKLFIHGIINQDPGGKNPLIFFHKGESVQTDWDAIMPKKIDKAFSFWYEEKSAGLVTIHSKVLVIDPFGSNPYVITGSHNFGPKASQTNDENLLIINDARLAEEYAVNIMAIYDHYRWRYSLFNHNTDFKGLSKDREWMSDYINSKGRMKELEFWK